jgi:replication factor C subunit 3/5
MIIACSGGQGFKLIILDEADSMTQPAQAALRRVMEKYTRNVRFCIIGNYVSKIIPALQSRCTRFRFAPLSETQIDQRVNHIVQQENVHMTEDGRKALLRLSKGDMRRMLNILQSTHAAYNLVNEQTVYSTTGQQQPADVERVLTWLLEQDFQNAHQSISALKLERGLALQDLLTELFAFVQMLQLPRGMKIFLLEEMADIEQRVAGGCSDKIQLANLVSAFQLAKDIAAKN